MKQPTPQPAELANLVRTAREALDISQIAVARAARVSRALVQSIEAETHPGRVRPDNIRAIGAALQFTSEQEREALRFAGHDPDQHATAPRVGRPTVSERQLVETVSNLSPRQRQLAHALLNELGGKASAEAGAA